MQFYPLAKLIDLFDGYCQPFWVGPHQLMLVQVGGQPYIIESHCPHKGHPLSQATFASDTVHCPLHSYQFCLQSGKVLRSPGEHCRDLKVYEVSYEGRDIGVVL